MDFKSIFNKAVMKTKKHSPEILIVTGAVGVVVAGVKACKATYKGVDDILDKHHEMRENLVEAVQSEKYDDKQIKKATTKMYIRTGMAFAKLYGPSVLLGTASLACIFASNSIMRKRNASLAAAYMMVDKAYKEYRKRVVDRFGEETDYELLHNIKKVVEEVEEIDEKGKTKKVKKEYDVADPNTESIYTKYFTRTNPYWDEDGSLIQSFLSAQQHFANDRLKAEGKLVLNDVYHDLGFENTKAGMVVGWVYDLKNPNGDNYIQFDVRKVKIPGEDGILEDAYAVDFNVDGNIYDLV